ncbi:hypothetical protein CEXT_573381 [Caerostris extrusa]|uniref:Uncharacterized protein n=1 Tax=Caerostris extrusa TaxID=172846 RepID=A0AAV4XS76_CAEEX|nr:hypothetical protein CEXT_573381 [Caerostris extrusa]
MLSNGDCPRHRSGSHGMGNGGYFLGSIHETFQEGETKAKHEPENKILHSVKKKKELKTRNKFFSSSVLRRNLTANPKGNKTHLGTRPRRYGCERAHQSLNTAESKNGKM